ncbi:MAG TPA: hypothetical protein VL020_00310 [Pseudomonadales bacterium]|nr:hypothetical protein [Pseudomonadales bacterium]
MFEYLGLILTLLSWLGIVYILVNWRGRHDMSISMHAASASRALLLFRVVLVLLGGVFFWWLVAWLAPELKLSTTFTSVLALTILCQMIAGLIPDIEGWQRKVHRGAAWLMAVLYLPLSFMILGSLEVGVLARTIGLVCLAYMLAAGFGYLFYKRLRSKFLFFQFMYIVAFQVLILSAAYL